MTFKERVTDVRERVVANPWTAIGIAATAGAIVATIGGTRRDRGRMSEALLAAVGAFALRFARDLALRELAAYGMRWFTSEFGADREPEVR